MARFSSSGALFEPLYTQIGFIERCCDFQARHHQLREGASQRVRPAVKKNSGFPFVVFSWQRPREVNGVPPSDATPQACFVTLSRPAQAGWEPQRSVSAAALKCAIRPSVDVQRVPRLIAASSHRNAGIPFIREENRMQKTKYCA